VNILRKPFYIQLLTNILKNVLDRKLTIISIAYVSYRPTMAPRKNNLFICTKVIKPEIYYLKMLYLNCKSVVPIKIQVKVKAPLEYRKWVIV